MAKRSPVPSLGLSQQQRKKRPHKHNSTVSELELWNNFVIQECSTAQSPNDGNPTRNFQAPYNFLPVRHTSQPEQPTNITQEEKDLTFSYPQNATKKKSSGSLLDKQKAKSEPSKVIQDSRDIVSQMATTDRDINSYKEWRTNIFEKLQLNPNISESTREYFCRRAERVETEDIVLGTSAPVVDPKLAAFLSELEKSCQVSPPHLKANRHSSEQTELSSSAKREKTKIQISHAKEKKIYSSSRDSAHKHKKSHGTSHNVRKTHSQKLMNAVRSPTAPETEETLIRASLPGTPPTRSRIVRNTSSPLMDPGENLKVSFPEKKENDKVKRKTFKKIILKKLESNVQSPRRHKKGKKSQNLEVPVDETDELMDEDSSFILSPKLHNSVGISKQVAPGLISTGVCKPQKDAKRARSFSLSLRNEPISTAEDSQSEDNHAVRTAFNEVNNFRDTAT